MPMHYVFGGVAAVALLLLGAAITGGPERAEPVAEKTRVAPVVKQEPRLQPAEVTKEPAPVAVVAEPEMAVPTTGMPSSSVAVVAVEATPDHSSRGATGTLSADERAYNALVSREEHTIKAEQRKRFNEARRQWRNELRTARAEAAKSGDDSKVRELEAKRPNKKEMAYL